MTSGALWCQRWAALARFVRHKLPDCSYTKGNRYLRYVLHSVRPIGAQILWLQKSACNSLSEPDFSWTAYDIGHGSGGWSCRHLGNKLGNHTCSWTRAGAITRSAVDFVKQLQYFDRIDLHSCIAPKSPHNRKTYRRSEMHAHFTTGKE